MFLAADIGGTKSRLALFEEAAGPRVALVEEILPSGCFGSAEELIRTFLRHAGRSADRACLAIAGPVAGGSTRVTNLPWSADAGELRRVFGFRSVHLLNDLVATARAVPLLEPEELHLLAAGAPDPAGVIAVIAPGTGLGEAFLTRDGAGYRAHASEGGHGDFAPADALEADLLAELRREIDHVSWERVCSGPGLANLYRFFLGRAGSPEPAALAARLAGAEDPAPAIVEAALAGEPGCCRAAVARFAAILGAEAGNLALTTLATGGVYLGGGMAPRLLPFLEAGPFLSAFRRKGRLSGLLARIPVHVILEPRAALIGAADCCAAGA